MKIVVGFASREVDLQWRFVGLINCGQPFSANGVRVSRVSIDVRLAGVLFPEAQDSMLASNRSRFGGNIELPVDDWPSRFYRFTIQWNEKDRPFVDGLGIERHLPSYW